jgi:hypothetical protein
MRQRSPFPPENQAIFERIKAVTGVQNPNQLAKYLKITSGSVYLGLRGEIPENWLYRIAAMERCQVNWLKTGMGLMSDAEENIPRLEFMRHMSDVLPRMDAEEHQLLLRCAELLGESGRDVREFLATQFSILVERERLMRPRDEQP